MKLSMLMPVYNEGMLLHYSLETTLPYVDEAIIVNGSQFGPSTDNTKEIIDSFPSEKIKYFEGTFVTDDGCWDEAAQRNLGLSKVTGDFLMPHCGDMIYDKIDMERMRNAVESFPDKSIFYCMFIEFFCDINHIRLYPGSSWFPVPMVGDIPILSMKLDPYYENGPQLRIGEVATSDFVYVHSAVRFHYGWVKPFSDQVAKHVRNITMRQWKEFSDELLAKGEKAIYAWAINHVLEYDRMDCKHVFVGKQPQVLDNQHFSYLVGLEESLDKYETMFGEQFWKESY